MKNLVLIRHAESEWGSLAEKDAKRTLTKKGRSDARQMANRLSLQKILPEKVYSSTATRALETAGIFMEIFNIAEAQLTVETTLYEPSVKSFYDVAESIPANINTAFIFSHNPGISEFVNDLHCYSPVHMPPCGVFALQVNTNDWADFGFAVKQFRFYFDPL